MDVPTPRVYNYAVRVTLPYQDLSGVVARWADKCERCICFEHEADEEIRQTHVHMILFSSTVQAEALKRTSKLSGKGNEFWSWKDYDGLQTFITYMSKGKLAPKFVKNYSPAEVEAARTAWSEPTARALYPTRQSSLDEQPPKNKLTKHGIIAQVVQAILTTDNCLEANEARRATALTDISDERLIRVIRNVLMTEKQVIGLYKVMDLYDAYVMYYQKDKFLQNCLLVLEKRKPRL